MKGRKIINPASIIYSIVKNLITNSYMYPPLLCILHLLIDKMQMWKVMS